MKASIFRFVFWSLAATLALSPNAAFANCTTPAGIAGDQIYNSDHSVMQYCNGAVWVNMGSPNGFGTMINGDICTSNGVVVNCNSATISLTTQASGTLQTAQFPALTGDVTTTAGSLTTTIAANAVTAAKFRQSAALSVVGNPTNSAANVSDISGSANQVLAVNSAGTALGFGALNLASSAAVTGVLSAANLGSGAASSSTFLRGDSTWAAVTSSPGGSNKQVQYNNNGVTAGASNLYWDNTNGLVGLGTSTPGAQFHMASGPSAAQAAWTTNGIGIRQDAATYTDSSSSGTVANNYVDVIGVPTLATSSNTVTYTTAATMVINGAPVNGSHVTITNPYALLIKANAAADIPIAVQANASQSNNLTQWQSSSGTVLTKVDSAGEVWMPKGNFGGVAGGAGASLGNNIGGSNGQIQYNANGALGGATNFIWNRTAGFVGLGTATASAELHISGSNAISAPAWTTNGIGIRQDAQTYTDTGGGSGTSYVDVLGAPTLASSGTSTYTTAATLAIAGAPAAGTGVTITNPLALYVAVGTASFMGNVGIGTAGPQVALDVTGAVRAGSSTNVTACGSGAANGEGSQRYNYTTHQMEFCNGTAWITPVNAGIAAISQYSISAGSGVQDLGYHVFCSSAGLNGGATAGGDGKVYPNGSANSGNLYDWNAYQNKSTNWSNNLYVICIN